MSKNLLIAAVIIIIIAASVTYFYSQNNSSSMSATSDSMMETKTNEDKMMNDNKPATTEAMMAEDNSDTMMMKDESKYIEYSKEAFDLASDKKRIYFFHATWCPTCKAANTEFTNNLSQIPNDVMLFKTDYDKETDLKKKFKITYQHTFVLVDTNGNELKKWNGGGLKELISNTK